MPVTIYRRQNNPDDSIAQAIMQGTQGFIQGRQLRQQNEDKALANALMAAKIGELQRKTAALDQPAPKGYQRDPYTGRLVEDFEQTANLFNGGGGGGAGLGSSPFMRVGGRTVQNPNYMDPLEQKKLDALAAKEEEARQAQQNKEELARSNAESMVSSIGEAKKGAKYFGPFGGLPSNLAPSSLIPGQYGPRKNWESNVNKILSQKVIDVMMEMKNASKTGASGFGALSEKELAVLQGASTVLNRELSPQDAVKYLNDIEGIYNKVLGKKGSMKPSLGSNKKTSKYEIVSVQ